MSYDLRPNVHFTPPKNWANDPNGMIYINGTYHFFYQHRPYSYNFIPNRSKYKMHWGHAVSKDLIHWEHLPIALFPDTNGDCWSGSCVLDVNNVSGLSDGNTPPLLAFYTTYVAEKGIQEQNLAYSTDYVNFKKFSGNPIMPNPNQSDFRDPKVFWNPIKNCYSMVITGGNHVEFYASKNLLNWEKTGEFDTAKYGIDGICECPDCFPVNTDEGEKWILISSLKVPKEKLRINCDKFDRATNLVQYFIGSFDGDKFIITEKSDTPLLLDYGLDFYGAVSFADTNDRIIMSWAANWEYAKTLPTDSLGFRGVYTLPRKLNLIKTDKGYRLSYSFIGLDKFKASAFLLNEGENPLKTNTFGLKIKANGEGDIVLSNTKEKLIISVKRDEIVVDRTKAGRKDFSQSFALDCISISSAPITSNFPLNIDLVFDKSILELIADNGKSAITSNVYPTAPYEQLTISENISAQIYEIK